MSEQSTALRQLLDAHNNSAALMGALTQISLLTHLGGEVADYADVVDAVRRLHAVNQELLEALKQIVNSADDHQAAILTPLLRQARAAIARAEGEKTGYCYCEPMALQKLLHQVIYGDFNADNTDDLKLALAARKDFAALQLRREWQTLSDEEIYGSFRKSGLEAYHQRDAVVQYDYDRRINAFARAVEEKLRAKNSTLACIQGGEEGK